MAQRRQPARRSPLADAADLHVHTTHSDGACTPAEIVRNAASVGLGAVAITDHDTLSAIAPAQLEAERFGIELIPGIELTAERDGREIHILGHFIRHDDPTLVAATDDLRQRRVLRIEAMVARLGELGLSVNLAEIRRVFSRATIGRKHLADWLVKSGQVHDYRAVFQEFLGDGGKVNVPKPRIPWREAIDLIRSAGGVAGLAHPPFDLWEATLQEYAQAGLGAIEVAGPGVDRRVGARWRNWANSLGLAAIAGTDFHAPDRPGRWVGAITTSADDLARLRALASSAVLAVQGDRV